ncbi:TolC family protein [Sideroxydans lithotrophicus]|uniref:Outer membrane efflux protein n=1 Tax=Sideroxydans lithotrophicus (strain ES-1) TaxID=580332 RepID=D5CTB6_SIDLE|nr:TolC family protein [Sideroxydans lithotrophicus]ADE12202.1 outer membrane efflux protein [Sideroxydans lithotrophicus ES-1]
MSKLHIIALALSLYAVTTYAAETDYPDLPPHGQVDTALSSHINVMNAETGVRIEEVNQRKWDSGNYEFNLRAGSSQRQIANTGQKLKEWDVTLERPLRLINKVFIDSDIGEEVVARANFALGDARHEAGRTLLHLWFNWQREEMQVTQWQQQVENLTQQALTTDKRLKAGDAPRMELSQANAAVAQATVSLQQAKMRAELAGNELARQFPSITLPVQLSTSVPQPIPENLEYWKQTIIGDNHELEMVRSERRIQQMLAQRSRADRIPDPTLGIRYSNEMGGNERVTGVILSIPISFGLRSANAENAEYQAQIAGDRENAVRRRLEGDIYAAYTQAINSYQIWQQASEAAASIRQNADLVARAYSLGESSLSETLTARRLALESTLSENLMRLDANEARYRLQLDAHQLWKSDTDHAGAH